MLNDATSAIRETQNELQALDEKKNKEAIAALERAAGKLEIILAREPELALAPSGVNVVTYDILSDIDAIKALRKKAEDALEDGRLQEARHLIRNLASETLISVTNIPLATYPDAIKLAAKHIDDDKAEEAKNVFLILFDGVLQGLHQLSRGPVDSHISLGAQYFSTQGWI